jgi:predicted RNA-binding Zn ribbon-like protein
MSSTWPASQRYRLPAAPGGLALVQDFLNTQGIGEYGPDLLADAVAAGDWLADAVRTWSSQRGLDVQPPPLTDADVSRLRALRETISQLVAGAPPAGAKASFSASLTLSDSGEVDLEPAGAGWRWLASALWAEVLLGQRDGTWERVKRCRNHDCGAAFYDRSRNNSGVWHDARTCGNAANLRASRARRRAQEASAKAR